MSKKRALDIPKEITDALAVPPVEYLRQYWESHSTEEERTAAEDRDATVEGAYAFIEDFSRRAKHGNGSCLPDQIVYDLCGIFMRICVDGDVYATAEEIAKEEEAERKRLEAEEKRKAEAAKAKEEAEKAEMFRLANLTPEEREKEEAEKMEREAAELKAKIKAEEERKAREEVERIKREKREAAERKKALAAEMAKRQMTFF